MSNSVVFDAIETLASTLVTILSSNIVLPFVVLLIVVYIFSIIFNLFRR